jgi:branched-chain amino acid transport system substrate-binding protein
MNGTRNLLIRTAMGPAFAALLAAGGCQAASPAAAKGGARLLKLGAVLSLTGPAGTMGGESLNGLQLAVAGINQRGKVKIDLKTYDDKTDPNEAAKLIQQVAEVDGVDAIVGPSTSPNCLRTGKMIQDLRVPAMTPTATNDKVTSSGEYMSRVCFIDPFQGEALARFLTADLKLKRAVLVIDKANDYSVGLANSFRTTFVRDGGVIAGEETYATGDADFSALISKVARYDVDAIVIPGWYSDVGPMLKQAGDKWNRFVLLGGDAWDSPQLFELSGGNIRNAYISTHYAADDPDPQVRKFVTEYEARFGTKPGGFAALGYDVGLAMENAALRAPEISREALKQAINSTHGLKGVSGTITLNAHRDAEKPATIVEVLPNGYRFKTRIGPS